MNLEWIFRMLRGAGWLQMSRGDHGPLGCVLIPQTHSQLSLHAVIPLSSYRDLASPGSAPA